MNEACRSLRTQPDSRRTLRWWLTVGWATSQQAVKSQAQTPPPPASWRRIARRGGSAPPWSRRTSGSFERFTVRHCIDKCRYRQVSISSPPVEEIDDDDGDDPRGSAQPVRGGGDPGDRRWLLL